MEGVVFMKNGASYLTNVGIIGFIGAILSAFIFSAPEIAHGFDWLKAGQEIFTLADQPSSTNLEALSNSEIGAGLKDALKVGTQRVVEQLGQPDGFNSDKNIHIALPEKLQTVHTALNAVGMGSMMDDLELKLNRAAEQATPQAKALFWESIQEMTIDDVKRIYNGPQNAATQYFQQKMGNKLADAMRPLVQKNMSAVGAVQAYDSAIGQYSALPFVPDVKEDLTSYVVQKGMDGIFYYLGREEAAIRQNPAKRTTEIMRKVFGSK